MSFRTLAFSFLAMAFLAPVCRAADDAPVGSFKVQPAALELKHPRHWHALQVLATDQEGYTIDLRDKARITSADPKVAMVEPDGWVRPIGSGQTLVTVVVVGQTQTIPVKVTLPPVEPATSFRHEVMPVLSRAGCNMGACHGYSLGKNGFKLSLRGSDPEPDFESMTKDAQGRRLNFQAPAASLVVAKPLGDIPHEGGVRFQRGSLSEKTLVKWIGEGAPGDLADPARVVAVRLIPDKLVLRPGQKHRVQLLAQYSDGSSRDVTRLAVLSANNTQFADVDDNATVTAGDAGETALMARFERTFAATSVLVLGPNPNFTPTPLPADPLIDRHVVEKLNRLKIMPSPRASDEELLRRFYVDLIGIQPRPEEVRAFLASTDPKKHEKVVDSLFERPEFVDHWSLKWGDLLQNSRSSASLPGVYLFREFLRSAVASNMPLDVFARKILTAHGGAADDPASAYYSSNKDANDTVERVTQVFCGIRMLCARCHTHPMENWTQADYYGLASFFNQVSVRPDPRMPAVPNAKLVQIKLTVGPATNPRTGKPQPPRFLGGTAANLAPDKDRREAYAAWLTAPDNPFFARSLVNRFWSYFFHRGIIDPVDDLRSTNPPINPALLDALTGDFVAHKFDLRQLMKRIVLSETYQRSARPNESNKHDEQNFSHTIPRRIPAEALLDSLVQATGVPENFSGVPAGFRAAQLPDGNVESVFLRLFGKAQRMDACECERDNTSNMLQALHFINGKSILGRVQNGAARPVQIAAKKLPDAELVTELYLWTLARRPSAEELQIATRFIASYDDRKGEAAQDLMWALLNSRDFLLLH